MRFGMTICSQSAGRFSPTVHPICVTLDDSASSPVTWDEQRNRLQRSAIQSQLSGRQALDHFRTWQTVNLLADAFAGSNPALPTTCGTTGYENSISRNPFLGSGRFHPSFTQRPLRQHALAGRSRSRIPPGLGQLHSPTRIFGHGLRIRRLGVRVLLGAPLKTRGYVENRRNPFLICPRCAPVASYSW